MVITNCDFVSNVSTNALGNYTGGGALWVWAQYGGSTRDWISDCTFTSNSCPNAQGGAVLVKNGNSNPFTISGCTFTGNDAAHGGGVFSADGDGTPPVRVERCTFTGNSATSAGAAIGGSSFWHGEYEIENCLFYENTGSFAIYANGSRVNTGDRAVDLIHCTIVDNAGGGVYVRNRVGASATVETLRMRNSIVANNGATGVEYVINSGVAAVLEYNDVYGHTANYATDAVAGTGSLSQDPEFIDAATDDYRMLAGNALLDAGTNLGVTIDLLGDPRPEGSGYAMGCYEAGVPRTGTSVTIR